MILVVISIIWMHKHTEHVYIWIFLWIIYEYCLVIYQSFGCIDMLNLCIYESFELLIVNVGYEYEHVLWTWVWYECLPFLLYLCVNLLVCLLWDLWRVGVNGTPSSREELHLLVRVATTHQLFFIFLLCHPPPPLTPCRNVFGLKTNIVQHCFWGLMKNRVLLSVGWPAQQMGCWSTTE